ncbi:hypothetical protein NC652_030436 [Populus alba x Populus x berolinensis]|nr:hypothetical protein NC652_030436 [Populus alba x Populus x berolinensis]
MSTTFNMKVRCQHHMKLPEMQNICLNPNLSESPPPLSSYKIGVACSPERNHIFNVAKWNLIPKTHLIKVAFLCFHCVFWFYNKWDLDDFVFYASKGWNFDSWRMSEGLKQGKKNVEKMAKPRLHMTELDDRRANSSNRGSREFSCASSVTSDEGCGTRAPGAVC